MEISEAQYVPILKWRQGEYQALLRLKEPVKDAIVPLLIIPPVEFDFEEERPKKDAHEHVELFPKRFHAKWGKRKALIDLHSTLENASMSDGTAVIKFIFDGLRTHGCSAIPVVKLSNCAEYLNAAREIFHADKKGMCVRVSLPELIDSHLLNSGLSTIAGKFGTDYSAIDLVIDLEAPKSFEPYSDFSKALVSSINRIHNLRTFRSFAFVATSIPLAGIKKPGGEVGRHEWHLYKHLVANNHLLRKPAYGDYSIETPDFASIDMRKMRPSGKIVYTSNDVWFVTKGGAFRGNESQMIGHCRTIISSPHWCGEDYSDGDRRIFDTSRGIEGTGNLSTWKQVGVSHHLTKVVDQLSKLHAS